MRHPTNSDAHAEHLRDGSRQIRHDGFSAKPLNIARINKTPQCIDISEKFFLFYESKTS